MCGDVKLSWQNANVDNNDNDNYGDTVLRNLFGDVSIVPEKTDEVAMAA